MKRFFCFYMLLVILILGSTLVYATAPILTAPVRATPISGIIPLTENNLDVQKSTITLDLENANSLNILNSNIERQAKLTYFYEIYNPNQEQNIEFSLPFLSRFLYLPNAAVVKINGVEVENKLMFSNYFDFDHDYNLSDYLLNLDLEEYKNIMYTHYEFKSDMDGYLYKVTNPKTRGKDYLAQTKITFSNIDDDTFITNKYSSYAPNVNENFITLTHLSGSEESAYFFSSKDVEVQCITKEAIQGKNTVRITDELLESAKVTKSQITFSEFLNKYCIDDYNGAYKDVFIKNVYLNINEPKQERDFVYIKSAYEDTLNDYQLFSINFAAKFSEKTSTTIEISFDIPLFCDYINSYKNSKMAFAFVANPSNLFTGVENLYAYFITKEKLLNYDGAIMKLEDGYRLSVNDPNKIIGMELFNSDFKKRGCFFLSAIEVIGIGLIVGGLIYIRRKRFI